MTSATHPRQIAIVGRGRVGNALAGRLTDTGHRVIGPLAREYSATTLTAADMVLLCVPDREIPAAAELLAKGLATDTRCPLVGHCSGATGLDALAPLPGGARFSLHPLMSFAGATGPRWEGVGAAIAASTPSTLDAVGELARDLGLMPFEIAESDRAAYHAAASMASNFLITLELAAERLAHSTGCEREALLPLVRATVENWAAGGPRALTGPIARGDATTVARQRAAVLERAPELLELFDVLARATHELVSTSHELGAVELPLTPIEPGERVAA